MMEDKGLLEIARRLIVDEEYRTWFMTSPKHALTTELGISPSVYDSLVAALPVLLAGGLLIVAGDQGPDRQSTQANWGGRRR